MLLTEVGYVVAVLHEVSINLQTTKTTQKRGRKKCCVFLNFSSSINKNYLSWRPGDLSKTI